MVALPLRADFDAARCRACAKASKDGPQARRLLALAAIYEGASRSEAARLGGVTVQIVRDWVENFNRDGPAGLVDRKAPGPSPKLSAEQRARLVEIVERGPTPAIHGVVRWRLIDLVQWIWEEFRVSLSETTVSRTLKEMGYTRLSVRPRHHEQQPGAIEDFKKVSRPAWTRSPKRPAARPTTSRCGSRTRPASARKTS